MNINDGIVTLEHKSCAALTVQCLADAGITDRRTAFDRQIANAKSLGLMPDDFKVIRETLQQFGFFMQSTAVEGKCGSRVLSKLGNLGAPAVVFLQASDYMHRGGCMVALRTDGNAYVPVRPLPRPDYLDRSDITHVWIRWDDGVDRSPFPRKTAKRQRIAAFRRTPPVETDCYKPYQPNPCGNSIGDCVVRATAGVLDISWNEAIDVLAAGGEVTVNAREVYPRALEDAGFIRHSPMTSGGRRLDGRAFCEEMNKVYRNGERIFAHVGRLHVAAIVPVGDEGYKIVDSWDSSRRLIGEYWVQASKAALREEPQAEPEVREDPRPIWVGQRLCHPTFGEGTVTMVSSGFLKVDFGVQGMRCLGEAWVREHCLAAAAQGS